MKRSKTTDYINTMFFLVFVWLSGAVTMNSGNIVDGLRFVGIGLLPSFMIFGIRWIFKY